MRALYKYPQSAYPYDQLVEENARRTVHDDEYELLDTGKWLIVLWVSYFEADRQAGTSMNCSTQVNGSLSCG